LAVDYENSEVTRNQLHHMAEHSTSYLLVEIVERDRPGGRPARRLSDDITDWCGFGGCKT